MVFGIETNRKKTHHHQPTIYSWTRANLSLCFKYIPTTNAIDICNTHVCYRYRRDEHYKKKREIHFYLYIEKRN